MRKRWLSSIRVLLQAVACVVSMVMLLSFPAAKAHAFGTHFRNPEVRRTIERHTSIAHPDQNLQKGVAPTDTLPRFFIPIETVNKIVPLGDFESIPEVPLPRLLNRLKLNPSGSSGQDPLLSA